MALVDTTWYCNAGDQSTTGHYAVTKRPQNTAVTAGQLVRQFTAPAVGSERVFVCIVAGTTANVTDATWVLTRGAKTTDGTATWMECTGQAALNGDLTNTTTWAQVKATTSAVLGQIIKRSNNASYQICTTAGTMSASEPTFSDTAGVTTTDTTAVWTSLGVVGNFTGGQAPFARIAGVCGTNWAASNNTIYVASNHAESQATAINITPPSVSNSDIVKILCHNSGSYPPASANLTTGATVSTTGAASLTINAGNIYVYGLTFKGGVGAASGNAAISIINGFIFAENCSFQVASSSSTSQVVIGTASGANTANFNNCTVSFANAGQHISVSGVNFTWQNTGTVLAGGSVVPTRLIGLTANLDTRSIVLEALDLSQITTSIFVNVSQMQGGTALIKDCKLNAAATISDQPTITGHVIQSVHSDSAATAYKSMRYSYEGTETTETSITRVGGATDPSGQVQSRKIVTTANTLWLRPFKAEPYAIWNATTGANVTVTVYGTINAGALPNNDDIWLEIEYLGSSATPLGTIVTTTKAGLLAANAAVSSDASTWNGGGSGAGWSPFKLTKTLSSPQPGMAGYIHARVRAAKASTTYYIDPLVTLT